MMLIDHKAMLNRLLIGRDLEPEVMEAFIGLVMDGAVAEVVVAAVLAALRAKGETGVEVAAAARAMRSRALEVPVATPSRSVDTCGTGGDGAETINISTAAALLVSAAGVPVAKHGNRSVSSRCGSADVLEAAGIQLDLTPQAMATLHDEVGIAFLFAPRLHPAMKAVMPVRRALGVRTVFNLLGPLTNPAGVERQVIGVWGSDVLGLMASALAELGAKHGLVVHSDDGLDEISVCAPTTVIEVRDGEVIEERRVDPAKLGIEVDDPDSLKGGDVNENLRRLRTILAGDENSAAADAVALNAGAALYVAGEASDLESGFRRARDVQRSGAALETLENWVRRSRELGDDS
ncbi:MAG: anthranilate phosphoribosyltransferase [Acidobacteria bacterium]|jgi:anthranilate phosphoribosyltransferase|nr:anthranilate phosphoribosyltransferase [Acidobacteriota bacterium]